MSVVVRNCSNFLRESVNLFDICPTNCTKMKKPSENSGGFFAENRSVYICAFFNFEWYPQRIISSFKMKGLFSFFFLIFTLPCFAQESPRKILLDSLNIVRESDKGVFNLYIKKPEIEFIAGVFRNRESIQQGFEPFTFTYHVYLPFQFDLNYVNLKAKDKLLKINAAFIVQHSKYGNYAIGLGSRFSFLVVKKTYVSYQIGLVWCEVVKRNTNDGINDMGFSLHHEFSICYNLSKHIKLSANAIHLSNGHIFKNVKNNQDVLGMGVAYLF